MGPETKIQASFFIYIIGGNMKKIILLLSLVGGFCSVVQAGDVGRTTGRFCAQLQEAIENRDDDAVAGLCTSNIFPPVSVPQFCTLFQLALGAHYKYALDNLSFMSQVLGLSENVAGHKMVPDAARFMFDALDADSDDAALVRLMHGAWHSGIVDAYKIYITEYDVEYETALIKALRKKYRKCARYLIAAQNANVTCADVSGCTPLHWADTVDIARLLVESGANVNALSVDDYTPLTSAAERGASHMRLMAYLISVGSKDATLGSFMRTLHFSSEQMLLINSLVKYHA